MRPRLIEELISLAVKDPLSFPPIYIHGPPGVGKSAVPFQVARRNEIGFVDWRASQRDPTDVRGIPAIINGKAIWTPPAELPTSGRGILLLDELSSAPPLVQVSLYQLTFDRAIGEYKLPDGWYIIAAGNKLEDKAVVYRMSSALANRFIHIEFEVSQEDWIVWAMEEGIDPNIIAFISWRGGDLLAPQDYKYDSENRAFPTPRTWAFASKVLRTCKKDIVHEVLTGTIGAGATAEFMAFLKVKPELPDLKKIFDGENFVPTRIDLKYALVSSLVSQAKDAQFERMVQYSSFLPEEFCVLLITMLSYKNQGALSIAPSFPKWAREHMDVIVSRKRRLV